VPFHGQGRRGFGAQSVHGVREGERREEHQACEREADKGPTCLRLREGMLFQQVPKGSLLVVEKTVRETPR